MTEEPWTGTRATAKALGFTEPTVRRYARLGCPHRRSTDKGSLEFQVGAVRKWMEEEGVTGKPGMPARKKSGATTTTATTTDGEPVDLKERRLYWQAYKDKLQALKFAGTLLDAGEVHAGRIARIQAVKQGLLTQPRTYSGQLFACATEDELREAWLRLNRELLRQFAGEDPKTEEEDE